jgi:hypothetical protein
MDPAMDADLVAVGDHRALLVGIELRHHRRHEEARLDGVPVEQLANARHRGAVAVLALRQPAGRILAVAQWNRIMVAVERQRDGDPRAALPHRRLERAASAHLVDLGAPGLFRPFPGLLFRIVLVGHVLS